MSSAYYTVKEVALIIKKSERTVWRYLKTGLPHTKDPDGVVLISAQTIMTLTTAPLPAPSIPFPTLPQSAPTDIIPPTTDVRPLTPALTSPLTQKVPPSQKSSRRTNVPLTSALTSPLTSDTRDEPTGDFLALPFSLTDVRPLTRSPEQVADVAELPEGLDDLIEGLSQAGRELTLPATLDGRVRFVLEHTTGLTRAEVGAWTGMRACATWPTMEYAFLALEREELVIHACHRRNCPCYRHLSKALLANT